MQNILDEVFSFYGIATKPQDKNTHKKENTKRQTLKTCGKCIALECGNSNGVFSCKIFGHLDTHIVSNFDRIYSLNDKIPVKNSKCARKPRSIGELNIRILDPYSKVHG